jgi:murein DD-endopeptidase MepM/ murein hydrolase activator NlpD
MNVIIVKKNPYRESHPLFSFPTLVASLFALFVVLIGVAYVAYHYGGQQAKLAIDTAVLKSTPAVQASVSPTLTNRFTLSEQDKELEELASNLGDLQAQIIQLNEISKQLVALSQLDEKEFDFTFDWNNALTEEQIIALEDPPEEVVEPEIKVAAKSEKADKKAEKAAEPKVKVAAKSESKTEKASDKKADKKAEKAEAKKEVKEEPKASKQLLALAPSKPIKENKVTQESVKKAVEAKAIEAKEEKKAAAKLSVPDVKRATKELTKKIEEQKEEIAAIEDILLSRRGQAKILPAGWPIRQGYFSSGFGMRGKRMHKGVDLVTKSGSNIYAVEDGEVSFSGQMRGYGNLIEIKHSGTYSTRYGHNTKNLVRVGDRVKKGQIIGLVGATGRATTAHVHFELLRNGSAINPMKFLAAIDSFKLAQK